MAAACACRRARRCWPSCAACCGSAAGAGATGWRCCARPRGWALQRLPLRPGAHGRRSCRRGLPPRVRERADRPAVRRGAEHAGQRGQRRGVPARAARRAVQRRRVRPTCCCRGVSLGDAAAGAGRSAGCSGTGAELRLRHAGPERWPRDGTGWRVDGEALRRASCWPAPPAEAARLAQPIAPDLGGTRRRAALRADRHGLPAHAAGSAPARADAGVAGRRRGARRSSSSTAGSSVGRAGPAGLRRSAARDAWVEAGLEATLAATLRQAAAALGASSADGRSRPLRVHRREARHLPLHAGAGAPADADRAGPAGRRRLRRRARTRPRSKVPCGRVERRPMRL